MSSHTASPLTGPAVQPVPRPASDAFRASIIIPVYNAGPLLRNCLRALEHQTVPASDFEVIVVDDGSTDGTADIVREFPRVRLVRQGNQGPAAARNRGVELATAPVVVFTDSDCEPTPGWLEALLQPFADPSVVGTKGVYRTHQRSLVARFTQLEYEDKYDRMRGFPEIDFIDTYAAAFRREDFLAAGGYDPRFRVPSAEDVDLSYRLAAARRRLIFVPDAIVYHRHPERLAAYLGRKYRYARWRMLAVRKTPSKALRDTHSPPANKVQVLLVAAMAVGLLAAWRWPVAGWLIAAAAGGHAASMLPFLAKAVRRDWQVALAAPALLFLRSVFQGAGLAHGVLTSLGDGRRV